MGSGQLAGLGITAFLLTAGVALAENGSGPGWLPEISPYMAQYQGYSLTVGGMAQATLSQGFQPAHYGLAKSLVSGAASMNAAVERESDSGLVWGVKSTFQLWHDQLASDNYGGNLVQKVYGQLQTGLGSAEIGMNDGAAYTLAVTGPVVDQEADLDNPNATFFRDPSDGRAFISRFSFNSAVEPTLNYAKISYFSPKLFGVQVGVSYTPSAARYVLPFADRAPRVAGRQENFWETGVHYEETLGLLSVRVSGSAAFAHADSETRIPGGQGLTDWALGAEIGYPLTETATLKLGGAYHHANSYTFDINNVYASDATHSAHLSGTLELGDWSFGLEYGDGGSKAPEAAQPALNMKGYEAVAGYKLNDSWLVSAGWQQLRYSRDRGTFYNGDPRIQLNAVFLHLHFQVQ